VTVTNLVQRGYSELSHSERAAALAAHHGAIKSQGKRTDLIGAVETLLDNALPAEGTSDHSGQKLNARELLAKTYGIGGSVVERYLRVHNLIAPLKTRLDSAEFPLLAAVEVSYLKVEEQELLEEVLKDEHYKLTTQNAKILRTTWRDEQTKLLTAEKIRHYLTPAEDTAPTVSVKVKQDLISRFFNENDSPDEIADIFEQALEAWFAAKDK